MNECHLSQSKSGHIKQQKERNRWFVVVAVYIMSQRQKPTLFIFSL